MCFSGSAQSIKDKTKQILRVWLEGEKENDTKIFKKTTLKYLILWSRRVHQGRKEPIVCVKGSSVTLGFGEVKEQV